MELTVELKEVSEQNMKLMDAETKLRTQLSLLQQVRRVLHLLYLCVYVCGWVRGGWWV